MSDADAAWVIIPARGGSKGIPRKNLAQVGGESLLVRAIRAAHDASLVARVIVSTDDPEITAVAQAHGVDVVERPPDLSGDIASSESALEHAVEVSASRSGAQPSVIALLQCTAPFTTSADIDGTLQPVVDGQADSAFAAVPFKHFVWGSDSVGQATGINHDGGPRARRQDLAAQYLEAGSVYAMRYEAFQAAGHRFCGRTVLHEVPASHCFEIDTPEELREAQALARLHDQASAAERLPTPVGAVVFDFDGVFTDNAVWVTQDGQEAVRCSRGDGLGLSQLHQADIPMLVLSKERNPVVAVRCEKLGLPVQQGVDDKRTALMHWLEEHRVAPEQAVYFGNDTNDLPCLELVGCAVGPADSHPDILGALNLRLQHSGGHGAVRELCDLIAQQMGSADD